MRPSGARDRELGDFADDAVGPWPGGVAPLIGAAVALLALALLDLIGLITHLAYTGTLSTSLDRPGHTRAGGVERVRAGGWGADRGCDGAGRL